MNLQERIDRIKNNPAHREAVGDGLVVVKSATIATPYIDHDQRLVKGIISTPNVDEDNEVVQCNQLSDGYFPTNVKTVYIDHDYKTYPLGVGVCRSMAVRGENLYAQTYILPTSLGDDLMVAIEHEAVRHFSIGARATDYGPPTEDEIAKYGPHKCNIRKGKLIEYSFTAMPANANAMMELVSKSMIRRDNAVALGLPDTPVRKYFPTLGDADIVRAKVPKVIEVDGIEIVVL
jgi:hypothetical protein